MTLGNMGLLYQKWRDDFGQDDDDVLVVQGPSALFNPRLDPGMIARQSGRPGSRRE
jgi:hypothetical protein